MPLAAPKKKPAPPKPASKPKPAAPTPAPAPAAPARKPGPPQAPTRMQTKLEVGPAGDRFEHEADRIAEHAMRAPLAGAPAPRPAIAPVSVQRKALDPPEEAHRGPTHVMTGRHRPGPGPEERDEEHRQAKDSLTLQRAMVASPTPAKTEVVPDDPTKKEDCGASMLAGMQKKAADGSGPAPAHVQSTVDQARAGGGAPLSPETRADMESRLGRDFGGVRVHSGAPAAAATQAVGAQAFTVGNDVFFGAGRYRPDTDGGKRLLAHELVHTVQQGGGSARARPARLQRATEKAGSAPDPKTLADEKGKIPKTSEQPADRVFDGKDKGSIEVPSLEEKKTTKGIITLPALQLPEVLDDLKGTAHHKEAGLAGVQAEKKDPINKGEPWTYKGRTERSTSERAYETWVKGIVKLGAVENIRDKIKKVENAQKTSVMLRQPSKARVYYLVPKDEKLANATVLLTGTEDELLAHEQLADRSSPSHRMLVPLWHKTEKQTPGKLKYYDADHIMEEQLGGADSVENMWLWESGANQSSGSRIYNAITNQAKVLINAATAADFWKRIGISPPEPKEEVRDAWTLEFKTVTKLPGEKFSSLHWMRTDILKGEHITRLRAVDDDELAKEGFLAKKGEKPTLPNLVHVYTNAAGGEHRRFALNPGNKPTYHLEQVQGVEYGLLYRGFRLEDPKNIPYEALDPTVKKRTTLIGTAFGKAKVGKEPGKGPRVNISKALQLDVLPSQDLGFGGYVDKKQILAALRARAAEIRGASPFEVTDAGINENGELYADGSVTATKALFPDFNFALSLRGDAIYVNAPIPAAAINLGPIHVTDAALRLGANDYGVFIEGGASLLIDGLGSGHITATASSDGSQISGDFTFDIGFLKGTEAKIKYDYATDAFNVNLEKEVSSKDLPGVAGGHISITLSRGAAGGSAEEESPKKEAAPGQSAAPQAAAPAGAAGAGAPIGVGLSGDLKLAGPLKGSSLQMTWDPKLGIVFAAQDIPLPVGKIPGVQEATVSITVRRDPETGGWHVSGAGGASFQIAGVDGKLLVAVDGAAITIQGTGAFQKGLAKGSVTILATNLQRDADGNPAPDKTTDKFTISGKGAAELQLGKILRGGVALEVTPDGRIIIAGEVSLPPDFPVFGEEKFNKRLFHAATPDFPIWGVSVAGFGIGVFAFFDADLDFDAHVGPGLIKNARAGVTFELDHPEDAVVDGCGDFSVTAGAGLTLDIGGGLKVELGPAEGDGRVGLDARLGIEAEGDAHLGIHWSRQEGLALDATIKGTAKPQFEVNANARLHVSVDLLLGSVGHTWGPWKKPLGKFGPEMEVGITAPVAWSEAKGLDFDVNKVDVKYPDISVADLMKSAFLELV